MKWTILLLLLMITPMAMGAICLEPITPNVQCELLTPSTNATTYEVFDSSANSVDSGSLGIFNDTIKYFNLTLSEGEYITILSDLSTRELSVGFGGDEMNSWVAIILALSIMTLIFAYFAIHLKERRLNSLKAFLFLLSMANASIIGMLSWVISNNPTDVTAFAPIGVVYLSVNSITLIGIVYYYAFYLFNRGIYD